MVILMKMMKQRLFMALLLLVCGAATGETWAIEVTYHIINNSGNTAISFLNNTTNPTVHNRVATPFATNYRFYNSLAAAQDDATNGQSHAASNYSGNVVSPSATLTDGQVIYVRYDYNSSHGVTDANGGALRIDGSTWYNMNFPLMTSKKYIYYQASEANYKAKLENSTSNLTADTRLWKLVGTKAGYNSANPDPYDIKIVNRAAEKANANNVLAGLLDIATFTNYSLYKDYLTTIEANNPSATHIQRFFINQEFTTDPTAVQIKAAGKTPFIYKACGNASNDHQAQWWYVKQKGDGDQYLSTQRVYTNEPGNSIPNVSIDFTPQNLNYYFHVIRANGEEPMDIKVAIADQSTAITMPADIKTPYITNDAAYKFFDTAEHAAAYSASGTVEGELTTYDQVTDNELDIYIGYRWDGTVPDGLPKLDGTKFYAIKGYNGSTGENFRYYYTQNTVSGRPNGKIGIKRSTTEPLSDATYGDMYYWKFTGNDPYAITVTNTYNNLTVYANHTNNSWGNDFELSSTQVLTMAMLTDPGRSGTYTLARMRPNYGYGTKEHVGCWGLDNGANVGQFVRTERSGRTYYNLEDKFYGHLTFPDAPPTFTFHLPTAISKTELAPFTTFIKMGADGEALPPTLMPEVFKRKYISSYQFYANYDASQANYADRFSNEIKTYGELKALEDVYIKYTVGSLPYTISTDWETAKWYRIQETTSSKFVHLSETAQVPGDAGTYTLDYQYALFGDPYELKVANRSSGVGLYLGVPSGSTDRTPILPVADGNTNVWEILPATGGETNEQFRLRAFNTAASPHYCGFQDEKASYTDAGAITMTLYELPKKTYDFYIVDRTGRIAIHQTKADVEIYTPITVDNLPQAIVSPYILDETISGYVKKNDRARNAADGRKTWTLTNPVELLPESGLDFSDNTTEVTDNIPIYISYTVDRLLAKPLRLDGRRSANVIQTSSSKYLYAASESTTGANGAATTEEKRSTAYIWSLENSDPYAVQLKNIGEGKMFKFTPPSSTSLAAATDPNTFFVLLKGSVPSDNKQVKFALANGGDSADGDELKFESNLPDATYYIIDKNNKIVISGTSSSGDLEVPTSIASPLVGTYHYWKLSDFTVDNGNSGSTPNDDMSLTYSLRNDTYTLTGAVEIKNVAEALSGGAINIYVTYDVTNPSMFAVPRTTKLGDTKPILYVRANDASKTATTYKLHFLNGERFYQEDGKDARMTTKQAAVYPYSCGDAGFYIYGQEQWDKQISSAATTRTRWLWYLESVNMDPYHVKIASHQNQTSSDDKNTNYHSYFRTYPVSYGSPAATHIVTGVTNSNPLTSAEVATEYMILGTAGHGLLTTVDFVSDGSTNTRRTVNSFEQYWKTYETISKNGTIAAAVTDYTKNDDFKDISLHSYQAWANARPIDGTDATIKKDKKFEKAAHWFQTVRMDYKAEDDYTAAPEFMLEEVSLRPALILLDQHGWEIMRTTIPSTPDDDDIEDMYAALRVYNSPMVERYHYWKTGTRETGYRKFTVSDYAVTSEGHEYTTEKLGVYDSGTGKGNLPDYDANGKVARDWYVTYDVKPEYTRGYQGAATEAATKASAYLIKMDRRFARASDVNTLEAALSFDGSDEKMLWYLRPNFNIDREEGYIYKGETGAADDAKTKAEAEAEYVTKGQNGFDPYNMQMQSKAYNTGFLTTSATSAYISEGRWVSDGYTTPHLYLAPRETRINASGHDQVATHFSNTTYMVVDDGNGNMRLMPRFDNSRVVQSKAGVITFETSWHAAARENDGIDPEQDPYPDTQTYLIGKPTVYTYHVINKSGREALRWQDNYTSIGAYHPQDHFPNSLKAYGATNFRYLTKSEFDPDDMANGVYTLINKNAKTYDPFIEYGETNDIYVLYDVESETLSDAGLVGNTTYNMQLTSDSGNKYAFYDKSGGTVSADKTSLTADEKKTLGYIWRIDATDPYDANLYPFQNYDATPSTFVLLDWDHTNKKYKLMKVDPEHTDSLSEYQYLAIGGSGVATYNKDIAGDWGTTLSPTSLTFTYKLYDLAGNLTLEGTADDISNLIPNLPAAMRSPLVKTYHYYSNENMTSANEITSLAQSEGTVYVDYETVPLKDAFLKLDGSEKYTLHHKSLAEKLVYPRNPLTVAQTIGRRENYYEWALIGRNIDGQYDPYDVAVYHPTLDRYWQSNVRNDDGEGTWTSRVEYSAQNTKRRYMILGGVSDENHSYIEIQQKKVDGTTYYSDNMDHYQYLYLENNGSGETQYHIHTIQNKNNVARTHGGEDVQWKFQPTHRYHIINMSGEDVVTGVESRLVVDGVTRVELPQVLKSPVVTGYHFYDITSFNVSDDGIYTLKSGAAELTYFSEATTNDIYVTYTNADIDKSWDLNGSKAYNIVFATDDNASYGSNPDAIKQSYMWWGQNEFNTSQNIVQTRGSYYRDGWQYVDVDPASVTTVQKESNPYLWFFTGGDPYNLTVHNLDKGSNKGNDEYLYRTSDGGQYNLGVTIGTHKTNTHKFILTGYLNGSSEPRFNLMSVGNVSNNAGLGKYGYRYLGRTYHDNPHRNGVRQVYVIDNDWAYYYYYNTSVVSIKLEPRKLVDVTYVVLNSAGTEAIRYKEEVSSGMAPQIPLAIKSPFAKNFKYWNHVSKREEANKVTETTADAIIYVTYDVDTDALTAANLAPITGSPNSESHFYNVSVNGRYLFNNGGSLLATGSPQSYTDDKLLWYLKSGSTVDPYNIKLQSKSQTSKYVQTNAVFDNTVATQAMGLGSGSNVSTFILMNGQKGYYELLAATQGNSIVNYGSSAVTQNRLAYLGYTTSTNLVGWGSGAEPQYQSGLRHVQVQIREPLTGITYHIINMSGQQTVQYTVKGNKGDALEVPEEIRSPFATGWTFYTDEECTNKITDGVVPDAGAHIYCKYKYDDTTADKLQLDGGRFYNMKVADWYVRNNEDVLQGFNQAELTAEESTLTDNLWGLNGTTASGIDPYQLRLVNEAYPDIYAGGVIDYVDGTEDAMHLSDGEESFRSSFFLVGTNTDGPFELVVASGLNVTNNELVYVNRHDADNIHLTQDGDLQHGNNAAKVQFIPPTGRYLYKVYNRKGELAVQAWGNGVAGGEPEIPVVIKSPLVSQYYYDVETLPYTTGTTEIRVTYDVDDDNPELAPLMNGQKFYNLKFRNNYFLGAEAAGPTVLKMQQDNTNTNRATDAEPTKTPAAGDQYVWTPSALNSSQIDPYDITLKHSNGNWLYTSSISAGDNALTMGSTPGENDYQKFVLVSGNGDYYQFMVASGDKISDNSFAYLGVNSSNQARIVRGNAYTQEKTAIQIDLQQFQYSYTYVIVNNDMYETMRYAVVQDGGDPVVLPSGLRSPLIDLSEYEYYTTGAFSPVGSYQKQVGESTKFVFADDATKAANKLTTLPYGPTTIYVRYKNSMKPGGLDLSGVSRYQIMNHDGSNDYYLYAQTTASNHYINTNGNLNETEKPKKYYQWRLYGDDPYNVKITNVYREDSGNSDMNSDILMSSELWYRNGGEGSNYQARNQSLEMRPETYESNAVTNGKYRVTRFAILGHEDGNYRVMAIAPFFWDSDYYDLSTTQRTAGGNNLKQERYYTLDGRWALYNHGRDNYNNLLNMNVESGISVQFLPMTNHNYRFHLTTKVNGRKIIVEKPNIMARSLFELPEELKRKYCTYTAKYYVNKNGSDNPANWDAVDKDAAGAEAITLDLTSGTEVFPYFNKIDIMPESTESERTAKANTWVDIYVDYKAHQHYKTDETGTNYVTNSEGEYEEDPEGMPFNVMAWNTASVQRLLDNEGGFTDAIFQISTYDQLLTKLGTFNLARKDYLYFMVMNTNGDFSNQNGQYFLRREDDGSIAYLNNDYRLHKDSEKNYHQWPYSRVAESYKAGDNAVFQEKRWLWCFAGDPYDFYVFNASSVVEENFNLITGKTEVTTHRDHIVDYERITSASGATKEFVVKTPDYSEETVGFQRWGLAPSKGDDSNKLFSLITSEFMPTGNENEFKAPTIPPSSETETIKGSPVYWVMDKSTINNKTQVMLKERDENTTKLDYNIQLLPYEPMEYVDMRLVFKRDDDVAEYDAEKAKGRLPDVNTNRSAHMSWIDNNTSTGVVRMYSISEDRRYAVGDKVTKDDLPIDVIRKFCNYTTYSDIFTTEGDFVITSDNIAHRGSVQRYAADEGDHKKGDIIYNDAGKPMYNYWKSYVLDGEGNKIPDENDASGTGYKTIGCPPTTAYIKYEVTTDMFLKTHPTKEQLELMINNNDHVYFMDFADPSLLKGEKLGYNNGHHAYYDPNRTFQSQIGETHGEVLSEKMRWDDGSKKFVYDTAQKWNYNHFRSTTNRMESVPENLKWYFVGDPYKMQVYCTRDDWNTETVEDKNGASKETGMVPSNLCRYDPTETSFQFVVDCVHFRTPDYGFIDERDELIYIDEEGNNVPMDNPNKGKPYYADFYWEVVPTTTNDNEAFALRFRADNYVLGYSDVYYYLAHDGLKRTYREAISENPKAYNINLSYDETNARYTSGKYLGYHQANNNYCAIRLTQPAKVYVSAYKDSYAGEPVVTEELSEYFGVGETLTEVPRHLQRKYVKYDNLQYQCNNNDTWQTDRSFPATLANSKTDAEAGEVKAFNLEDCDHYEESHTFVNGTTKRVSYKFRVTYSVDDITKDDIHLFTSLAEFANPEVRPQWLDVTIGGNRWMYYDKMNVDDDKNSPTYRVEDETERVSSYPTNLGVGEQKDGWDIGIKGLHWAFIGDPYKFTIVNRRRWEDSGMPRTAVAGSTFWLGTGYGTHNQAENKDGVTQNWQYNYTRLGDTNVNSEYGGHNGAGGNDGNGNTEWSLMMAKTGGASDYYIRTSSRKTTSVDGTIGDYANAHSPSNLTNDFARLTYKDFVNQNTSADPNKSNFVLETFSLDTETKDIHKAEIRTAVAKDEDRADNDCFDANVHIYNLNGELKATLKHVELTYGDVFKAIPPTLRRYGCDYIECYQLSYAGFTDTEIDGSHDTEKAAKRKTINTQLQKLSNFTGDNKKGSMDSFGEYGDGILDDSKMIVDENGRKYYEIAYVYKVDDDVAQYFTTTDDAEKEEYTWANANYQWDQVYQGSNVRVVTYENVFDHYEYNADGHIINEVYKLVEKVSYKSGENISTPAYGWVNTHNGSNQSYGDETTQSEENNQKWAFVGDPYDFEMKNYELFLSNSGISMFYDEDGNSIINTTLDKSHWAIVQGLRKTEIRNGKTVNVTDDEGNPVYVYYLALIDDDEMSETYGDVIQFVTFDRALNNKDLPKDEQNLYLKGAPISTDPTGTLYDNDTKQVHPFYFAELKNYANMVVYHLVIAHQHSTDFTDASLTADQKSTIRRHLAEYLHYKLGKPATGATTFDDTYLTQTGVPTFDYQNGDTYMQWDFQGGYQTDGKASGLNGDAINEQKKGTLRDLVTDPVENYIVQRVGIGNSLTVPWYMKRQFCDYDLYQRNVYRSETSDRPVYEEADAAWIAAGKSTTTIGGIEYKVDFSSVWADPVTGRVQKTFMDNGVEKGAYEVDWIPVADGKEGYAQIQTENGTKITKLNSTHKNRMVLVDVVYEVAPEEFRFADEGRTTTAWYSMFTNNDDGGLTHFSYKDGVDARRDRTVHNTNDYLWAPEGDPYGFVLHNRYATVNGTGWDKAILTTDNASFAEDTDDPVTITDNIGGTNVIQASQKNHNAVYEMFAGVNKYSFLMHPTSAAINTSANKFSSCYVCQNTTSHRAELLYSNDAQMLRTGNHDANWRLMTTPEQLLPYFERAGYVGGLQPEVAGSLSNQTLYTTLQNYAANYRSNPSVIDFTVMDRTRELVYGGTFENAENELPQRFAGTNTVPLGQGYFRFLAYSREALDNDNADIKGKGIKGIQGPRYISGYRHLTEAQYSGFDGESLTAGTQHLHFYETDEEHATVKTFAALNAIKKSLADKSVTTRNMAEHPAMRGNIEIPTVEYDPSSIFHFEPSDDTYGRYTITTQGLNVQGVAGSGDAGRTSLSSAAATQWRLQDIGAATVTAQILSTDGSSEENIKTNMQANYLCIDDNHRWRITVHSANEMEEMGDSYASWSKDGADYAVQSTKWLLQPVGTQSEWPYNEMPFRVKVNRGAKKSDSSGAIIADSDDSKNYYASLYVPFDVRLNKTTDAAFTGITDPDVGNHTVRMTSVSQLNNMGNPQFVPAKWPVVIRTSQPLTDADGAKYVEFYLPTTSPTTAGLEANKDKILLKGEYLERKLVNAYIYGIESKNIMVFGLPFDEIGEKTQYGDAGYSKQYYAYNEGSAVGFYTNENWYRGQTAYSTIATQEAFDDATNDLQSNLTNAHWATARKATSAQRSNKYVYNNKAYYIYDSAYSGSSPARESSLTGGQTRTQIFYAIFDDIEEVEPEDLDTKKPASGMRWGVFDLSGRQLRTRDAVFNGTWRRNLPPGMYIVNGRKLLIE